MLGSDLVHKSKAGAQRQNPRLTAIPRGEVKRPLCAMRDEVTRVPPMKITRTQLTAAGYSLSSTRRLGRLPFAAWQSQDSL